MNHIDTQHMSQDDLVRRWSSDAAINWDDNPSQGEGGFIACLAVCLFVFIAVVSFVAAVMS